jgi:cysteine desulfurase
MATLRNRLEEVLLSAGGVSSLGTTAERLPGALAVCVDEVPGDALIAGCPGFAFSRGSACSTGSPAPSHVLLAMGLSALQADNTVRFGLTRFTTELEIEETGSALLRCIERVRGLVHA